MTQPIGMMSSGIHKDKTFFITPAAFNRLSQIAKEQGKKQILHIQIDPGGCSGFQYQLTLLDTPLEETILFSHQAVQVSTDLVSWPLIQGLVIDYKEEMMGSYFIMQNPNALNSCGCGNSFTVF